MAHKQPKIGWFTVNKRHLGDRTLEQQLTGLGPLVAGIKGKTVLDVGAAEGLISIHLVDHGAIAAHGVEIVPTHVKVANKLRKDRACLFEVGDANTWAPKRQYDVVILLALLHKLKNPAEACMRFAAAARETVVIRLPPTGPVIIDERSESQPFDIGECMRHAGFELGLNGPLGPFDEWMGYYTRKA